MSHPYIIRQPERVLGRGRHAPALAAALSLWMLFLWLLAPLMTALFWFILGEITWHQMIVDAGLEAVREVLPLWLLVVAAMSLALFAWARVNQWRFRGHEHRHPVPDVEGARIAADFGVDAAARENWLQARVLEVRFDDAARITAVSVRRGADA